MNGKQITRIFIMAIIAAVVIFDVWVIGQHGKESSISWVIITELKRDYPLINDAFMVTMGHLFWRMKTPKGEKE